MGGNESRAMVLHMDFLSLGILRREIRGGEEQFEGDIARNIEGRV